MKRNPNIIGAVHFLNLFVLGFCLSLGTGMNAQIGGNHTFSFLNLPNSARVTALGSSTIATQDDDITLGLQSPSLLNKSMHQSFGLNHNFHLADISFGSAAYGHHLDKWGVSTMLGITYLSYGDFRRTNEFAEIIGEFTGGDIAFTLGASKKWNDRITTGVNLKWANSRLDNYSSSGIGLDIGVTYAHPEKSKLYTLVFKNVGLQYSPFNNETEAFPLDVQIGTSRRLKYLPLRISFILHDLNNWNIRSDGIEEDQTIFIDQEPTEQSPLSKGISNFFHHMILSGEFLLGQNESFRLRFGYNHQLKQELKVSPFTSFNGFSIGFGFKVKKIAFDYGFGSVHLAGGMNHLSLSTNFSEWGKR